MTVSILTILITSLGSIFGILLGGLIVQSRTKAETKKLAAEAELLVQETEDKVYARIRADLEAAVERADKADERLEKVQRRADQLSARIYELYDVLEQQALWSQQVVTLLRTHGVPMERPPVVNPFLKPPNIEGPQGLS